MILDIKTEEQGCCGLNGHQTSLTYRLTQTFEEMREAARDTANRL